MGVKVSGKNRVEDIDNLKVGKAIICREYNSFDYGNITHSTHAGVLGFYTITNVDIKDIDRRINFIVKKIEENTEKVMEARKKLAEISKDMSINDPNKKAHKLRNLSYKLRQNNQVLEFVEQNVKRFTEEFNRLQSVKLCKLFSLYPPNLRTIAEINESYNYRNDQTLKESTQNFFTGILSSLKNAVVNGSSSVANRFKNFISFNKENDDDKKYYEEYEKYYGE
jgi:hypothetical protein